MRVAYLNNYSRAENENFLGNELDLASLTDREDPENTWSFNYNAVLRPSLFVEAQYSQHNSSIVGAGSRYTDLIRGTLVTDRLNGARYNSPTFCGLCRPEERDNESLVLKGTYYLSRAGLGSHTIVGGYDGFNDQEAADNHQSGSDFPRARHVEHRPRRRGLSGVEQRRQQHPDPVEPDPEPDPRLEFQDALAVPQRRLAGRREADAEPRDALRLNDGTNSAGHEGRQRLEVQPAPRR